MNEILNDAGLDLLFRGARTLRAWNGRPVTDVMLRALYELMRWGPTSFNCSPGRIVFVRSPEGKQRLLPALTEGNRKQTMAAPVTAIVGHDLRFYEFLPRLNTSNPNAKDNFEGKPEVAAVNALRNGSLQGGYLILAARALGLDCGPMSGFDNAAVDKEFFPAGRVKSNFLCNLGYGDRTNLHPRAARLDFDEACKVV